MNNRNTGTLQLIAIPFQMDHNISEAKINIHSRKTPGNPYKSCCAHLHTHDLLESVTFSL